MLIDNSYMDQAYTITPRAVDTILTDTVKVSPTGWLQIRIGEVWAVGTKLTQEQADDVRRLKSIIDNQHTLSRCKSLC